MNKDKNSYSVKTVRDSNIELLRVVAMFLVLIDHSGYMSINPPTNEEVFSAPMLSLARHCSQSFSSICVNVFVLISGWFGIKAKFSRIVEFLFQCYFICFVVYFVLFTIGITKPMTMGEWVHFLVLGDLWFVMAYLLLYLFAPMMNMFIESLTQRQLLYFLLAFLGIQFLHGFVIQESWFDKGMSPLTLMSLYMIGRYMHLYPNSFTSRSKWVDILIYFAVSLFGAICTFLSVRHGAEGYRFFSYASPTIIMASIYFFLFFTKISFKSRLINWLAASAFAVYVMNCEGHFWSFYLSTNHSWWVDGTPFVYLIRTLVFDVVVFVVAILIDKIRIVIWQHVKNLMPYRN